MDIKKTITKKENLENYSYDNIWLDRTKYFNPRDTEYSLSFKLREQNKTNDEFESMLNNLSLEEIIGLKLEVASRVLNGRFYGLKMWHAIPYIARHGVLLYAISATRSLREAAIFLGVTYIEVKLAMYKYGLHEFHKKMIRKNEEPKSLGNT